MAPEGSQMLKQNVKNCTYVSVNGGLSGWSNSYVAIKIRAWDKTSLRFQFKTATGSQPFHTAVSSGLALQTGPS